MTAGSGNGGQPLAGLAARDLFEGLEGCAWVAARDGTLLAVGGSGWRDFAERNDAPGLTDETLVGRSMFEMMHGDAVRDTSRHLHQRACNGRPARAFEFRCDAPGSARHLRMAMSPVRREGEVVAVLYQSQLLCELSRPPLRLFDSALLVSVAGAAPAERQATLCSYCQQVAWPLAENGGSREWIRPEVYDLRGGRGDVVVCHGICPGCLDRLLADDRHAA